MPPEYVGILLNVKTHRGARIGRTGEENLSLYEKVSAYYGLKPCYLRLDEIDLKSGTSYAYLHEQDGFRKVLLPTPKVIHNRAIYKSSSAQRKLRKLKEQGTMIFNHQTRYSKEAIHRLLAQHPALARMQPSSCRVTRQHITFMMQRYSDLLLKPASGSVGKGILRLKQDTHGWTLIYRPSGTRGGWRELLLGKRPYLPGWFIRKISSVPYIIQERLPLAELEGRPLDIRVSVQRGITGEWAVTGLYAKVSAPGSFLSNLAQEGRAYPVAEVFNRVFPPLMAIHALRECQTLALTAAQFLSSRLPLLADLGIDIGVTADGRTYLIECNGRDQRYGFRKAGMEEVWIDTYRQPMAFARYLLQGKTESLTSSIWNKGAISPSKNTRPTIEDRITAISKS